MISNRKKGGGGCWDLIFKSQFSIFNPRLQTSWRRLKIDPRGFVYMHPASRHLHTQVALAKYWTHTCKSARIFKIEGGRINRRRRYTESFCWSTTASFNSTLKISGQIFTFKFKFPIVPTDSGYAEETWPRGIHGELLQGVRRQHQAGHHRGSQQPIPSSQARPILLLQLRHGADQPPGIHGAHEGEAGDHLLYGRHRTQRGQYFHGPPPPPPHPPSPLVTRHMTGYAPVSKKA